MEQERVLVFTLALLLVAVLVVGGVVVSQMSAARDEPVVASGDGQGEAQVTIDITPRDDGLAEGSPDGVE